MTSHEYALPDLLEGSGDERAAGSHDDTDPTVDRLDRIAEYGRGLWHQLHRVADFLRAQADSGSQGWTGEQWDAWEAAYAGTLDALAGPHGDSGYGAEEAAITRHNRQDARG